MNSLQKASDTYRGHHMQLINDLEAKRNALEASNTVVRDMIVMGAKLMVPPEKAAEMVHMCPVCFDKEVDTVLTPCGHTLCKTCLPNITNSRGRQEGAQCMTCRAKVSKHFSLYFSV